MKKVRRFTVLAVMIGSLLLVSGCSPTAQDSKAETVAGALNASYQLGKENIILVNGLAEKKAIPNSATTDKTQVWEQPVIGDLNSDNTQDAALCLINTPGGSGTFYYIAAAVKDPKTNTYKGTNAVLLGDRIQVSNISIEKNVITVAYKDRKKGEPMSATPSVTVSKKYVVEYGSLKEAN